MRKLVFLASLAGLSLADPASARLITFDGLPNDLFGHLSGSRIRMTVSIGRLIYVLRGRRGLPLSFWLPELRRERAGDRGLQRNGQRAALPVNFSRRMPFELDSFYLAAAWRDELEVTVTGELCSCPPPKRA